MLKRLCLIFLVLLPSVVWAQGLYEHPGTNLQFPARLAKFERTRVHRYDDPKLGVQVSYVIPELGKADFYVFDYGLTVIPPGINSDTVRSMYASADRDVQGFVESGMYLEFEKLFPLGAVMRAKDSNLEWYVAAYKFRLNRENTEPVVSWLLVTGYRNHFVKIRFSHLASRAETGRSEVGALLQAFGEANRE
ncbi:MAG: hypothetical protein HZC23_02545 [Rhodocyclales bacterium]|nr:hypothetical protein [Rhodocyclales bacterium]